MSFGSSCDFVMETALRYDFDKWHRKPNRSYFAFSSHSCLLVFICSLLLKYFFQSGDTARPERLPCWRESIKADFCV